MLQSKGNVAFEVSTEVDRLCKKHRLRKLGRIAAIIAGLALAGSITMLGYREYLERQPLATRERLTAMNIFDVENFVETASKGDVNLMALYLTAGMDLNAQRTDPRAEGITALMSAVKRGHLGVVEMLLEAGANVNVRDERGRTALTYAVYNEQDACLRNLLAAGADSDAVDDAFVAASGGYMSSFHVLLNHGVRQAAIAEAFVELAKRGDHALLHTLSGRIADLPKTATAALLEVADADGSIFREVPEAAQIETFNYLVELGGDRNLRDKDGVTLLSLASSRLNLNLARVLLENHADVNARGNCSAFNGYASTPLTVAINATHSCSDDECAGMASMVDLLIAWGADVNLPIGGEECLGENKHYDQTPLMLAVDRGNEKVVQTLLEKGANMKVRNHQGYTALGYVYHENILDLLLANGADINGALRVAIDRNWYQSVKRLVEAGADVNKKNSEGTAPLMLAAQRADPDMVKLLLRAGARTVEQDNEGRTAETFAKKEYNADEIVELLQHAGK